MVRIILGIVIGLVAAFGTIWAVDLAGHAVHPIPAGLNMADPASVGSYIGSMPPLALAIVVLAWFLGSLIGGLIAATIAQRDWAVWFVAGLVLLGSVANIAMISHPLVLQIGAIVAPILGGLLAQAIYRRRSHAAAPRDAAG